MCGEDAPGYPCHISIEFIDDGMIIRLPLTPFLYPIPSFLRLLDRLYITSSVLSNPTGVLPGAKPRRWQVTVNEYRTQDERLLVVCQCGANAKQASRDVAGGGRNWRYVLGGGCIVIFQ